MNWMLRPVHHTRVPVPNLVSQFPKFLSLKVICSLYVTLLAGLTFGAYHSGLFLRSTSKRLYGSLDSLSASSVFKCRRKEMCEQLQIELCNKAKRTL